MSNHFNYKISNFFLGTSTFTKTSQTSIAFCGAASASDSWNFSDFSPNGENKAIVIRLRGGANSRKFPKSRKRRPKTKVSHHSNNSLLPRVLVYVWYRLLWNYLVFKAGRLAATVAHSPGTHNSHARRTHPSRWRAAFPGSDGGAVPRIIGINRTRVRSLPVRRLCARNERETVQVQGSTLNFLRLFIINPETARKKKKKFALSSVFKVSFFFRCEWRF